MPVNPHRNRFMAAYVLLAAALVAGGLLGLVYHSSTDHTFKGQWSSWQPKPQGMKELDAIASHVASLYQAGGTPVLRIVSGRPTDQKGAPLLAIGLLKQEGDTNPEEVLAISDGVEYDLCATGSKTCALNGQERVMRRAALSLALYTFRYTKTVQYVMAYIPPAADSAGSLLLFQREDVADLLNRPLRETLPEKALTKEPSLQESKRVDKLTLPLEYSVKPIEPRGTGAGTALLLAPMDANASL